MPHKLLEVSKVGLQCSFPRNSLLLCYRSAEQHAHSFEPKRQDCTFGCSAEVPSFCHDRRVSPDTASSHMAATDESIARVRCRTQWRQQDQVAPQEPSEKARWTLRSITVGRRQFSHHQQVSRLTVCQTFLDIKAYAASAAIV